MKLRRTLFVLGAAILLWAVHLSPAGAATPSEAEFGAESEVAVIESLPSMCGGGVLLPEAADNGQTIWVTAGIGCTTNIDFLMVSVQLRRIEGGADGAVPFGATSCSAVWTSELLCETPPVACEPGLYYGRANLQAATFTENGSVTRTSQVVTITC